jgi:membrane associated rhomboid family serine protease
MFLHGGWLHLILNMWSLWILGPAVEDRLGAIPYLLFYLATGIAASVAHAVFNPSSDVPALGASGAIAGVIGSYVRLFPLARLVVVVPILFLPLFFEVQAVFFRGFVVSDAGVAGHRRTPGAIRGRWRCVVGTCRRV